MNELNAKKTYSRFGLTYSIGQLAYTVIVLVISAVLSATLPDIASSMTANLAITYAVLVLIAYPGMYLAIRKLEKVELPKKNLGIGMFLACFPIAYAAGAIANIIGTMINVQIGNATGKGAVNPVVDLMTQVPGAAVFVVAVILAPICEELTFRKFLLDRTVRFGEKTAVLMSGLAFGLYHGNLAQFAYAFVLGALFGFIYVRTGKIIYTILIHMFINGMSTVLSQVLLKSLDLEAITNYLYSGDMDGYMEYVTTHIGGFAAAALCGLFVIALLIVGIILMAVNGKKVVFRPVEGELEKGHIFKNVVLNVGMLVFIIYCVANIVIAQLGLDRSIARLIASFIKG
jgi:membrane protease YdiL (CAAX protease family)